MIYSLMFFLPFITHRKQIAQCGTYFCFFILLKMFCNYVKECLSIMNLWHNAPNNLRYGMFYDHKTHAIRTFPLLKVLNSCSRIFICKSSRLFFPKCKVQIHTTSTIITCSFHFLKFVSLST